MTNFFICLSGLANVVGLFMKLSTCKIQSFKALLNVMMTIKEGQKYAHVCVCVCTQKAIRNLTLRCMFVTMFDDAWRHRKFVI